MITCNNILLTSLSIYDMYKIFQEDVFLATHELFDIDEATVSGVKYTKNIFFFKYLESK